MKKHISVLFLLILVTVCQVSAQLAAGYGTDGNTLSLSTDPLHVICGEFRANTKSYNQSDWSHSDVGITQAYLLVRIFSATNVSLYAGGGLGSNLLSKGSDKWLSVNIPLGLRINPFSKFPDLFITGEYNPMIIAEKGIPIIHSVSLGFRYRFCKEK